MLTEAKGTNNEDQLLNKTISLETHVVLDDGGLLNQVFLSGSTFKEVMKEYC